MALSDYPWAASSGEYFPEVCQVVPDGDLPPCSRQCGLLREIYGDQCDYQRKMHTKRTLVMSCVHNLIIFPLDLRDFLIFQIL